ncbi:histidine kinase [Granulicella sp. S156]|uniref:histidine kinase n=1 Tax=Granulicella sp. S156 TaxID=1747224 RepID=UPI00131BDC9B|nr:histidine kinase [Granulicella sp. S156]
MTITSPIRRLLWLALAIVCVLGVMLLLVRATLHSPKRGLPYHDSFVSGKADEWKALGGTWELVNGAMRNGSDERGAKLLTGSSYWRNYSIEADVMLLAKNGDAGLVLRSNNEEAGVDSYVGYYAGLRNLDNSLVLGRASYGWREGTNKLDSIQGGIQPFHWYHLKLLAYQCQIVAAVSVPSQRDATSIAITDKHCIASGRVGLRSYSSGGVWRNVVVRAATHEDLVTMLGEAPNHEAVFTQPYFSGNPEDLSFDPMAGHGEQGALRFSPNAQPIGSLRLSSYSNTATATVRGVVILTSPALFVQDTTGGVIVPHANAPPLKVGDEVEVSGEVHPGNFSSSLEHATVRVLWAHTPMPAMSVTASQAATGAFDASFIEVEGLLRAKSYGPDNTLVFDFDAGPQTFRVIMSRGRGDTLFKNLKLNSLLRLHGVCVVDPAYTRNSTPFVLLLRSTDDLKLLAGPPWWSAGHLIAVAIGVLIFAFAISLLYSRAERWRLRAVFEERERLAHEMHDTLAQSFAGIGFQLEAIRNGVPDDFSTTHQQLDLASDLVRHSHEEARRSIATLRPESLQSGDLIAALGSCASRMVEGGDIKVATTCSGDPRPLPLRSTDTLYRIGQESIANAVRHARSTTITISIEYQEKLVRLLVADDGVGFTPTGTLRGFGLQGMRKRAADISAALQILSTPGHGTRVEVTAPLPRHITILSWPQVLWKHLTERLSNAETARQ